MQKERRECEGAEGDGDEHSSAGDGSREKSGGAYLALAARLDACCRGIPAPSLFKPKASKKMVHAGPHKS